ncbi:hypothetical protein RYA99_13990 [Pseudomonas syringae pv. actinidifoliorum]|nr:hypothetical protein [Pseudomonas syringae pv. actinidifoliorum]MDU8524415.1 hypothetical protein [Pseudomonas syringae pv. actinidifoliorum]MDU8527289.1 hypothetical protein [Pseudomonas syringae pv. actinidifoliorum]
MNHYDLVNFKNSISKKMADASFLKSFLFFNQQDHTIYWSKGPACSIMPLELEMSGVIPARLLSQEPKNKKNVYKYFFASDALARIESLNRMGLANEVETVMTEGGIKYSLRKNNVGELSWLKAVEFDGGLPIRACRLDADSEYWTYRYTWEDKHIVEITSFSSNSLPGIRLFVDYCKETVSSIYFKNKDSKVTVYNAD